MRHCVFLGFLVLVFVAKGFSETYYIDYQNGSDGNSGLAKSSPWKVSPGMKGFSASYVHKEGDVFVFKGGVTWPSSSLPLQVLYSGSENNVDTYTSDTGWFAGSGWTKPVFSGQGQGSALGNHLVYLNGKSFVKIEQIALADLFSSDVSGQGYAIECVDSHHLEISRCTLRAQAWIGIYLNNAKSGAYTNFLIQNCDISKVAMGIAPAVTGASVTVSGWSIHDNQFHDFADQINGGVHGDGIHTWVNDSTSSISDIAIYNNYFYGQVGSRDGTAWMTSWIQLTDHTNHSRIYNNVFTFSDSSDSGGKSLFQSMITLYGSGNDSYHYIYCNTFVGHDFPNVTMSSGAAIYNGSASVDYLFVKDNIFKGFRLCYAFVANSAHREIDYNCLSFADPQANVVTSGGAWLGLDAWRAMGFDQNSVKGDPALRSDYTPGHGSPCIRAGLNLGVAYSLDMRGVGRPLTEKWDIGALESGRNSSQISSPTRLRIKG